MYCHGANTFTRWTDLYSMDNLGSRAPARACAHAQRLQRTYRKGLLHGEKAGPRTCSSAAQAGDCACMQTCAQQLGRSSSEAVCSRHCVSACVCYLLVCCIPALTSGLCDPG